MKLYYLGLPNMDSKDIEEIFKGVLTDESQESQESSVFSVQAQAPHPTSTTTPLVSPSPHPGKYSIFVLHDYLHIDRYITFCHTKFHIYRHTSNDAYTKTSSTWCTTPCWSVQLKFSNEFSTAISISLRIQQVRLRGDVM